jgi:hypothetical protein
MGARQSILIGPFFFAPEMRCLDIVGMIVSPPATHSFWIPMIWHDVVVIREFNMMSS